jgi:hypothetical protein
VDFEQVVRALVSEFDRRHIRYAVIGGLALGLLGAARATQDLDLLIHRDDLEQVDGVLLALGYQRIARTENASHYRHPDVAWGVVDCLHAFRTPSRQILERVSRHPIFQGAMQIRVVQPEDLIGFKVQAIANDPRRYAKDHVDIEALMEAHGPHLDWERIQEYFDLFEMGREGRKLRERFGHAERGREAGA